MNSPDQQRHYIYDTVSAAIDRKPAESLTDAAQRIMSKRRGHPMWTVARIVLGIQDKDQWSELARATRYVQKARALCRK